MLKGLWVSDYRSIGGRQTICPLGKINLFVGPNNCGKSNVLRFVNTSLRRLCESIARGGGQKIASDPHGNRGQETAAGVMVDIDEAALKESFRIVDHRGEHLVKRLLPALAADGMLELDPQWPASDLRSNVSHLADHNTWYGVWTRFHDNRVHSGNINDHWVPELLASLRSRVPSIKEVLSIPISRRADNSSPHSGTESAESKVGDAKVIGGRGVILDLAAMQNPKHANYEEQRRKFALIQEFVRTVTDDALAEINVPHTQDEILVRISGQPFRPLADLGSGVEQVVLHAVAVTTASDAVVTFEEPELHLHPILQRQLIEFLKKTTNQYFIATHSAQMIDAAPEHVFHVRMINGETVIEHASTDQKRFIACNALGYRASDIVQANSLVWVEGPSDRLYLLDWLKRYDPHLQEGVHFSVMFYGGKLLSHLSAGVTDDPDEGLSNLIKLRAMNRHLAVVIDSDKKRESDGIRATKQRVKVEIEENGGLVWITAGREVENYVRPETMKNAVERVKPGRGVKAQATKFGKALPPEVDGSSKVVDKIAVAQMLTGMTYALDRFDLSERLADLSAFIRTANGLRATSDTGKAYGP